MSEALPLRSALIVGGGLCGLSAAAALARALPGVSVAVVATPPDPNALADRMPGTLPAVHRFHGEIGVDTGTLLESGVALPRLGTRMVNWTGNGSDWVQTFGRTGPPFGTLPFHQAWLAADGEADRLAFHRYSPAGLVAEGGSFGVAAAATEARFDWGLNLDPRRYRDVLWRLCTAGGVRMLAGDLAAVERRDDGQVHAILLRDGRQLEADIFIDCTGPCAAILSEIDPAFERWDSWLPSGSFAVDDVPGTAGNQSVDEAVATPKAWHWRAAHPGGTIEFAPQSLNERFTDQIILNPGRRPRPWIGNVVALGDAACATDPLHATNLHLAHSGIRRLLALLPDRRFRDVEAAEYNRRSAEETTRVRDFLALHHCHRQGLHGRTSFPPTLERTIVHFARRGRLPFEEGESFSADAWITSLLALVSRPMLSDAIVGQDRREQASAFLRRVALATHAADPSTSPS